MARGDSMVFTLGPRLLASKPPSIKAFVLAAKPRWDETIVHTSNRFQMSGRRGKAFRIRRPVLKQSVTWQAWGSDESATFAPSSRIDALRENGTISATDSLLHELVVSTGEDAMTQHHRKMGWEPYRPQGNSAPCPNDCGGQYYPLGYGDCPNCGHIG